MPVTRQIARMIGITMKIKFGSFIVLTSLQPAALCTA